MENTILETLTSNKVFSLLSKGYIKGIRLRRYTNESEPINFFPAVVRYRVKLLLGLISFSRA